MSVKPYIVGIDPGTSTGVGVLDRPQNKVIGWTTRDFFTVREYLDAMFEDREMVKIYVEHPFGGHIKTRRAKALDDGAQDVYLGDAGGNRREAQLLFETLRRDGWDVELVNPVREAKWDARRFKLFTGSSQAANQHERDAVRLAVYYANKR